MSPKKAAGILLVFVAIQKPRRGNEWRQHIAKDYKTQWIQASDNSVNQINGRGVRVWWGEEGGSIAVIQPKMKKTNRAWLKTV